MIFPVTMAVWITIVRRRFIMFKKNALKSFIVWHIVFSVGNCLLVIIRGTSTILPVQNFWLEFLILILDASFMISFNYVYLKKGAFYFTSKNIYPVCKTKFHLVEVIPRGGFF